MDIASCYCLFLHLNRQMHLTLSSTASAAELWKGKYTILFTFEIFLELELGPESLIQI